MAVPNVETSVGVPGPNSQRAFAQWVEAAESYPTALNVRSQSYEETARAMREYLESRLGEDPRSVSYCTASRARFFETYQQPDSFILNESYQPVSVDYETMSTWMAVESRKPDHGLTQIARTDFDDATSVRTYFTGTTMSGVGGTAPALFRTIWMPEGIMDVRVSTVDEALVQHARTVREIQHGSHGALKPVHDVRIDRAVAHGIGV